MSATTASATVFSSGCDVVTPNAAAKAASLRSTPMPTSIGACEPTTPTAPRGADPPAFDFDADADVAARADPLVTSLAPTGAPDASLPADPPDGPPPSEPSTLPAADATRRCAAGTVDPHAASDATATSAIIRPGLRPTR